MLTAEQIRNTEFQKVGFNGYKSSDVDFFLEEVAESLEMATRQNEDLIQKIQILAENIEEYRAAEDSVKSAILNAQKTGDAILREANDKAQAIADEMLADAKQKVQQAEIASQKMIDEATVKSRDMLDEATIKSKEIVVEAEAKAAALVADTEKKLGQQLITYNYIKDEIKNFKETVLDSYKKHIDLIMNTQVVNKNIEGMDAKFNSENE
ncbi:MAG: DivIVA domain-containing protein [Clostridia bacterium]|nr:DivIVA domain-containing protein [Clostridia bacterium]